MINNINCIYNANEETFEIKKDCRVYAVFNKEFVVQLVNAYSPEKISHNPSIELLIKYIEEDLTPLLG